VDLRFASRQKETRSAQHAPQELVTRRWSFLGQPRRFYPKRSQRLIVKLSGDLQAIANLITANRCREIRIHVAVDFAVVETFVLQRLLHAFNELVRPHQHHRSHEDHCSRCDFHGYSTAKPFAYSALF